MKETGALGVTMAHVLSHVVTAISPGQENVKIRHPTEELVKGLQWNSSDAMSTCHALVCKPSKGNSL